MESWSADRAREWYARIPWQAGFNYLPSTAVNTTEMWRNDTFDPVTIHRELGWAAKLGYNSVRVFLPYIVWERERHLFSEHFEWFLSVAAENGMTVLPVLFDDCAFDDGRDPYYGPQDPPRPGKQNSRWTPSPGAAVADDPFCQGLLREYVHTVVGNHAEDPRVLAWDIYNEPGQASRGNACLPLLVNGFRWARECAPTQPLTAAYWRFKGYEGIRHTLAELSDVLSFHSYEPLEKTVAHCVEPLSAYGKPLFVTEWLWRQNHNTFETHLPYWAQHKISCWHWGLVVGKTQTNLWWGHDDPHPSVWQHDVLYPDGTIYRPEEADLLRQYRRMT